MQRPGRCRGMPREDITTPTAQPPTTPHPVPAAPATPSGCPQCSAHDPPARRFPRDPPQYCGNIGHFARDCFRQRPVFSSPRNFYSSGGRFQERTFDNANARNRRRPPPLFGRDPPPLWQSSPHSENRTTTTKRAAIGKEKEIKEAWISDVGGTSASGYAVKVRVGLNDVYLLVDTGATTSLIRENSGDFVRPFSPPTFRLHGVTGHAIPLLGAITLPITTLYTQVLQTFHVVGKDFKLPCDGILGLDFLRNNDASIDFARERILLRDSTLPLHPLPRRNRVSLGNLAVQLPVAEKKEINFEKREIKEMATCKKGGSTAPIDQRPEVRKRTPRRERNRD